MINEKVKPQGVTIVVPSFNEEKGIGPVLEQLTTVMQAMGLPYEILVVDDGSTDGTADVVRRYPVSLVQHPFNRGYGGAIKTGIRRAQYELICITDADGTYPAERIPELIGYMDNYDMVVGARTGQKVAVPLVRRPAKWALNTLANYLAGVNIPDLNSGMRVFRRDVVLDFLRICPNGFSFTTTITLALLTNNYLVKFVPINYNPRSGRSKIRPLRDTINFLSLIVRTMVYFEPLRVFMPMSLGLFVAGFILLVYRAFVSRGLTVTIVVIFLAALQMAAVGLLADMIDKRSPAGGERGRNLDRGRDER